MIGNAAMLMIPSFNNNQVFVIKYNTCCVILLALSKLSTNKQVANIRPYAIC
jgi:hypothetical protein